MGVRVGTWAQQHHPPKTVSPETIFDMEVHEHMVTSMFRLHRRKDPKVKGCAKCGGLVKPGYDCELCDAGFCGDCVYIKKVGNRHIWFVNPVTTDDYLFSI